MDHEIKEYIRLIDSISLPESARKSITEHLIQHKNRVAKEITGKHIAAASAVAVLAFGAILAARGAKNNINAA